MDFSNVIKSGQSFFFSTRNHIHTKFKFLAKNDRITFIECILVHTYTLMKGSRMKPNENTFVITITINILDSTFNEF